MDGGAVTLYREGSTTYTRRNNWSAYGWAEAMRDLRPGEREPAILIHFDSHSDMHAAPAAVRAADLRAGDRSAWEQYAADLSVSTFVTAALYYGLIEEVWWVQPGITLYAGSEEVVSFSLEERAGWIAPRIRAGAQRPPLEALAVRAHEGRSVPRSLDLASAFEFLAGDWEPGPLTLRCLDLPQLQAHALAGAFAGRTVLVDLDLDYFGTSGAMRGYGYLGLHPSSHTALGLSGGILPVFWLDANRREREVRDVSAMLRLLNPLAVTICESPDHAHRDGLPELAASFRDKRPRAGGLSGAAGGSVSVFLVHGGGRSELRPECPVSHVIDDGASSLEFDLVGSLADSIEVSLYFDATGSRDRLIGRRVLQAEERHVQFELPSRGEPAAASGESATNAWLGQGWDVDVRRAGDGRLLFSAAFALESRVPARFESMFLRHAEAGRALPVDPGAAADLAPSQLIAMGRGAGLSPRQVHELVLAHPRVLERQCDNLRRFREGFGTVRDASRVAR